MKSSILTFFILVVLAVAAYFLIKALLPFILAIGAGYFIGRYIYLPFGIGAGFGVFVGLQLGGRFWPAFIVAIVVYVITEIIVAQIKKSRTSSDTTKSK